MMEEKDDMTKQESGLMPGKDAPHARQEGRNNRQAGIIRAKKTPMAATTGV